VIFFSRDKEYKYNSPFFTKPLCNCPKRVSIFLVPKLTENQGNNIQFRFSGNNERKTRSISRVDSKKERGAAGMMGEFFAGDEKSF